MKKESKWHGSREKSSLKLETKAEIVSEENSLTDAPKLGTCSVSQLRSPIKSLSTLLRVKNKDKPLFFTVTFPFQTVILGGRNKLSSDNNLCMVRQMYSKLQKNVDLSHFLARFQLDPPPQEAIGKLH